MVPMHLGLTDRSFVPHNLVSTQEGPVPLLQFQMAPRQNLNVLCIQERNPDILFLFSQKSWQTKSFQFPNKVHMERDTHLQGVCISLENLIQIPLKKKALKKKCTSMFPPKKGPLWKQTPISEPCLTYLLQSPVNEPSLMFPFMESLTEG
jgi:hypothetical protein